MAGQGRMLHQHKFHGGGHVGNIGVGFMVATGRNCVALYCYCMIVNGVGKQIIFTIRQISQWNRNGYGTSIKGVRVGRNRFASGRSQ